MNSLDDWTYVPDVMEEIHGWIYFHENWWVIWEWLRNLQEEESRWTSKQVQWILDEIASKYWINMVLLDILSDTSNIAISAVLRDKEAAFLLQKH